MATVLKVVDEFFGSGAPQRMAATQLTLASERTSVRELIRRRVADEVEALNRRTIDAWLAHARTRSFLVAVEEHVEARLNAASRRSAKPSPLDADAELQVALRAFAEGKFILLFDDRQIADLDEELTLTGRSEAVFLYLTPLRGG